MSRWIARSRGESSNTCAVARSDALRTDINSAACRRSAFDMDAFALVETLAILASASLVSRIPTRSALDKSFMSISFDIRHFTVIHGIIEAVMFDASTFAAIAGAASEAEKNGHPAKVPAWVEFVCNVIVFIGMLPLIAGLVIIGYCISFFLSLL